MAGTVNIAADLLQRSSAHGWPRIVAATTWVSRTVWFLACLLSTAIFIWHLESLFSRYHEEPTSATIKMEDVEFEFPDMVICNPLPLSQSHIAYQGKTIPKDFELYMGDLRAIEKATALLAEFIPMYKNTKSNRMNFINFGFQNLYHTMPDKLLGDRLSHFVQQLYLKLKTPLGEYPPLEKAPVSLLRHHIYGNCLRFEPPTNMFSKVGDKITTYLYTDATLATMSFDNYTYMGVPLSAGMRIGGFELDKSAEMVVFFVPKGYYPHDDTAKILIGAGTKTFVTLRMISSSVRPTRRQPCQLLPPDLEYVDHYDGRKFSSGYTTSGCYSAKTVVRTDEECGCVDTTQPIPWQLRRSPKCNNLTKLILNQESKEAALARIKCLITARSIITKHSKEYYDKCAQRKPCHRKIYSTAVSASKWPLAKDSMTILNVAVKPIIAQRRSNNETYFPGWDDIIAAITDDVTFGKYASENVVRLEVSIGETRSTAIDEEYTYISMNLFSDVGGICGLYLGMSVLTFVEVLEFGHDLIRRIFNRRSTCKSAIAAADDDVLELEKEGEGKTGAESDCQLTRNTN